MYQMLRLGLGVDPECSLDFAGSKVAAAHSWVEKTAAAPPWGAFSAETPRPSEIGRLSVVGLTSRTLEAT